MSTRIRLPRKATEAARYTFDAADDSADEVDEQETDEDDDEAMRARRKKPASKRRKVEISESEDDDDSGGEEAMELDENDEGDAGQADVKAPVYEIPRVDFSKVLPPEIVAEVLSYLKPYTLYHLSTLSKTLHSFFIGPHTKSTWRKAFEVQELPKLNGEEVDGRRLASLLYDEQCELCGQSVEAGDRHFLVRLCLNCRTANWVSSKEVGAGKNDDEFHPAVSQCAMSTPLPAKNARYGRADQYYYRPDLLLMDEVLVHLQLEDDLAAANPLKADSGPSTREVSKSLKAARRLQRWNWGGYKERATAMEAALTEKWTPRVKEFVLERMELRKERKKLAVWIEDRQLPGYRHQDFEGQTFQVLTRNLRRQALEDKVVEDGVFGRNDLHHGFANNALVTKAEPLTDGVFEQIKEYLYYVIGKDVAAITFNRSRSKNAAKVLQKPKSRSAQAWRYIKPELVKLLKKYQQQKKADNASRLSEETRQKKEPFMTARYSKIKAMQPNDDARAYLPRYGDFLALPTVNELYSLPKFGIAGADDEDGMKLWSERFDDILEEVSSYGQDVRLHAVRLILGVTTSMTDDELGELDGDTLASDEYASDEFFKRPSSWVCCSACGGRRIGPLPDILQHWQTSHPLNRARDVTAKPEPTMPVKLSLEVACAASAVFELGGIDAENEDVTAKQLDDEFEGEKLVWDNVPKPHQKQRHASWTSLLQQVETVSNELAAKGEVIAAPTIARKGLNSREKWKVRRENLRKMGYW
ncbi:hypothetical protein JCM8097_001906 [Rhodosporidiobolus ruineniae]